MERKSIILGLTLALLVPTASLIGAFYGVRAFAEPLQVSVVGKPVEIPVQLAVTGKDGQALSKVISVTGTGSASAKPDQVKIFFTVMTEERDASRAIAENARIFEGLLKALASQGISREDIKTVSFNVNPVYDYQSDRRPILTGYSAQQTIEVTVRANETSELGKKAGAVIDAAGKAGVSGVNIMFTISKESTGTMANEALKKALVNAQVKASQMAETLSTKITGVVSVSESSGGFPVPYPARSVAVAEAKAGTELIPGNLEISTIVYVNFSIE